MPNNFFQNIRNAAAKGKKTLTDAGVIINDDRGNALNIPINEQKPTGIYRTFLPSGNVSDVMVKINSDVNYPKGFTPEEAYYVKGTYSSALNDKTGLPIEQGNVGTNMSAKNNTGMNKISRTWMDWKPTDASPQDRTGNLPGYKDTTLTLLNQGPVGKDNKYNALGNDTGGPVVQQMGWTDPYFYITDVTPNDASGLTGIPRQFGTNPQNIDPNWNKKAPVYTTPDKMLHGEKGEIIGDKIVTGNIAGAEEVFDFFNNNQQYLFSHRLDKIIPDSGLENPANFKECYIGSTLKTVVTSPDNEDPVIFGYDIIIKYDSSPLFNGAIVDFINNFIDESEINSRKDIWLKFCTQFFKFFKNDQSSRSDEYQNSNYSSGTPPTTSQSNSSKDINSQIGNKEQERLVNISNDPSNSDRVNEENKRGNSVGNLAKTKDIEEVRVGKSSKKVPRTYYLKKIAGLDNLVEKEVTSNSDTIKSMVDYGKDIIKLSLYDDVSISTGYLSTLYKMMSWSRLNGKQLIPENLLRFDAKIVITEIRDFNRVVHVMATQSVSTILDVLPDSTNKYTYTLYDCQFLFDKLSHGDEIDMSSPKQLDNFDISFNYKYSTLSFDKFNYGNNNGIERYYNFLNNKKINPQEIGPEESNINDGGNSGVKYGIKPTPVNGYKKIGNTGVTQPNSQLDRFSKSYDDSISKAYKKKWERFVSSEEPILEKAKRNDINRKLADQLGNKLKRATVNEINRQITTQARLLNRTLDNIRNSIGVGRMSEPTNVYNTDTYKNDIQNAFREFVGNSVRGFFTP